MFNELPNIEDGCCRSLLEPQEHILYVLKARGRFLNRTDD